MEVLVKNYFSALQQHAEIGKYHIPKAPP